jgi:hypothetical protein
MSAKMKTPRSERLPGVWLKTATALIVSGVDFPKSDRALEMKKFALLR